MTDLNGDIDRTGRNPKSTAVVAGHPIHPMVVPFPIVCFVGAFVTDIFFVYGAGEGWATASKWLLGFGLLTAAIAAALGITDFMGDDRIRRLGAAMKHLIANVTAVVVAAVNLLIRVTTPETEVSIGIFLSGLTVLILLYSGWQGGHMVYVHRVGVKDEGTHHRL